VQAHEYDVLLTDVVVTPDVTRAAVDGTTTRRSRVDLGLWVAVAWLGLVVFLAVFADVLPLQNPKALDAAAGRSGPSLDHWLGTDQLARDQLSRIAYGARVSLVVGLGSAAVASIIGSILGLIAGYRRKFTGTVIMGWMDILLSVPALLLVIVLTSFLGPGIGNVILAISILAVPRPATSWLARSHRTSLRPSARTPSSRRRWPSSSRPASASSGWACRRRCRRGEA
jgi:ABC-type dipeptide/oligopeptide/nickel transport system permease subunit